MKNIIIQMVKQLKECYLNIARLKTKQIHSCLKIFAFIMLFVLFITIIYGICSGNGEKYIGLISALGILISALLASYSVMLNIENTNKIESDRQNAERSKFYLEKSLSGLNIVYEKLKDQNNDRTIWIHTARILESIKEIEKYIILDEHKKVYEIEKANIKHKIRQLLTYNNSDNRGYSMPLSFFLGIKEWKSTVISTEELKNISKYDLNMISISSIISIYSFLDISEDYKDPLEKISKEYVEHWLDNTKIPMLIKPDLKTYIERFK